MQGFTIYLLRLADYFHGRSHKNKKCDVCGKKFGSMDDMEEHRRNLHPDAVTF